MSDNHFTLDSVSNLSGRRAIFEDDGTSGWLYLTGPNDAKPVSDVWVHNRIEAPPTSEIASYRGGPPPAAIGYADDTAMCQAVESHSWSLDWHQDGNAVSLSRDQIPVALVVAEERNGWSKNLLRDGPWGKVWSDNAYNDWSDCDNTSKRDV